MSIAGPFLDGSFSRNNQFSATLTPDSATPEGALLWFIVGSQVVDTANLTITDTASNTWELQAFNQLPGTGATFIMAISRAAHALTTSDVITLDSDVRANWDGILCHHTGAQGNIYSRDLEYFESLTPQATCRANTGMTLFATIAVAGPRNDGFTQDSNWSADQKTSLTGNVTVHACGRNSTVLGNYTYSPVLGTLRKSLMLVASFT